LTIGERLKEARKFRGMSQDTLADKIGASRGVITNIEHDKVDEPQPMVVNAICSALSINKDWLLNNIGPMEVDVESSQSEKVLSELYTYAKELSEEEQLFILDIIKTYTKHLK
jgi:transcriptional regulator with XRE-family HTH domain